MRASVYRSTNRVGVVLRHARCGPHRDLAAVTGADHETPGVGGPTCLAVGPPVGFGVADGLLDDTHGVPLAGHPMTLPPTLSYVNSPH